MILLLLACRTPAVDADLPAGNLVSGDGRALARAAHCLGAFTGSEVAARAGLVESALGSCPHFAVLAETPDALASTLDCRVDPAVASLDALRGDADLAFALHITPTRRMVGTLSVAPDGALTMDALLDADAITGAAALLVGGPPDPGPALLANDHAVLHARVRAADGIDAGTMVTEGSEADSWLGLRSGVLSAGLLDGTWEAALYAPPANRPMPLMAFTLGVRSATAGRAAMTAYVSTVRERWKAHDQAFAVGASTGACFGDLTLLPFLAPCYVIAGDAIVVGWDARSVQHALDPGMRTTMATFDAEGGGIVVDFDQLADADRRMAAALNVSPDPVTAYPWGRAHVSTVRQEDGIEVHLRTMRGCAD